MLTPALVDQLTSVVSEAERSILSRIEQGRARQEPDITSRLMEGIQIRSEPIDGVAVTLETIDGLGRGAAESTIGADVLGTLSIDLADIKISKGFLLQAKMSGSDRLRYTPPTTSPAGDLHASHVFSHGPMAPVGPGPTYGMGSVSGTVAVTQPSKQLQKQCRDMLRLTPASFVLVLDRRQVSVVSAAAIRAHRHAQTRVRHDLGTKTLADFFVNVADCFIGDERLGSATQADLVADAYRLNVPTAIAVRVSDQIE